MDQLDEWMHKWMYGLIDKLMDGWTDGLRKRMLLIAGCTGRPIFGLASFCSETISPNVGGCIGWPRLILRTLYIK